MTPKQARKLLLDIHEATVNGDTTSESVMPALDEIYRLIKEQRCFCGRGWQRGGQRQGAKLCEQCFYDE